MSCVRQHHHRTRTTVNPPLLHLLAAALSVLSACADAGSSNDGLMSNVSRIDVYMGHCSKLLFEGHRGEPLGMIRDIYQEFIYHTLPVEISSKTSAPQFIQWEEMFAEALRRSGNLTHPALFFSCISQSLDRRKIFDFAYPIATESALLIEIAPNPTQKMDHEQILALVSAGLWYILVTMLFGVVFYLVEYRRATFKEKHVTGELSSARRKVEFESFLDSVYFSFITTNTVGFGDIAPRRFTMRFLVVVWMFGSLILLSILNAELITNLTPSNVEHEYHNPEEVVAKGLRVGVSHTSIYRIACHERFREDCIELDTSHATVHNQIGLFYLLRGDVDVFIVTKFEVLEYSALVKEMDGTRLLYHPIVLASSLIGFAASKVPVLGPLLASNMTQSILQSHAQIATLVRDYSRAAIDRDPPPPSSFSDVMANDAPLYTAVVILLFFMVGFTVGAIYREHYVAEKVHIKKVTKRRATQRKSRMLRWHDSQPMFARLVRRLQGDLVLVCERCCSPALSAMCCLAALWCVIREDVRYGGARKLCPDDDSDEDEELDGTKVRRQTAPSTVYGFSEPFGSSWA
eukprot:PhM_4_TR8217/c0_g1_i1/m.56821